MSDSPTVAELEAIRKLKGCSRLHRESALWWADECDKCGLIVLSARDAQVVAAKKVMGCKPDKPAEGFDA